MATGRDVFTGREYRGDHIGMESTGPVPRRAPFPLSLPGVGNLAAMLPGVKNTNGVTTMTDEAQMVYENLNPMFSRLGRFMPNTERGGDTRLQYALNFAGFPFRWNDPGSQAGEMNRRRKLEEERQQKVIDRLRLEGLTQ